MNLAMGAIGIIGASAGTGWLWTTLLSAALSVGVASAQEWSWQTERIDTAGAFTSVAVDHEGNVHLSYINGGVKYAFRPAGMPKWFTMDVAGGNGFTNITVDSANNPYICYTAYDELKYAHWDGKSWIVRQIAANSGQIAYSCAMAVAPDGTPHIIWYQITSGPSSYFHLKHAELKNGMWQARTVDFSMETGKWNSLHIDSHGVPHVSYSAYTQGEQKYAYQNGDSWAISTVESRSLAKTDSVHPGEGNSLLLTDKGDVLISYMDEKILKLARRAGTSWSIEKVDSISNDSWFNYRTSLVLDKQGFPHIAYEDAGRVKHAYWNGKQWHIQVVVNNGASAPYPSMAIDAQDKLYLSYQDPSDGSLKVAVGVPGSGGTQEVPPSLEKK
jgi:hypothetical protein